MDKKAEYCKEIEERKKKKKQISIAIYVLVGLEIINIFYFLIYTFVESVPKNFYTSHFCIPLSILFVGLIAILLPWVNKYGSFKSNQNNDKYITLGGIVLIFAALIMFIGSFA